jgi:lipopolysaccharide/colanic/teichoic acid biosynthesis glycosyltransferase
VLFLGFDHAAGEMARSMGPAVVGFLHGNRSEVPPDLPYAGKPAQLAEVVRRLQPTRIVVAGARSGDIPVAPRLLLDLRLSGIAIDDGLASYAEVFGRVLWREIERSPLHLLPRLRTQQFVMSLQAIYTNLAGLALLVLSLPGLIPAALAVKLLSGPGPVFERVECLGFQRVPFFMLRFRTRRADGKPAWIGRLLGRLRLVNLPQLVNVVRGEMAFIGPRPVRKEFGLRLGQLLDFYPARFICKPGMLGWSQIRLRSAVAPVDESVRLEYDLYYLQEAVPALDLEILIRSIFRHTSFSAINPR